MIQSKVSLTLVFLVLILCRYWSSVIKMFMATPRALIHLMHHFAQVYGPTDNWLQESTRLISHATLADLDRNKMVE